MEKEIAKVLEAFKKDFSRAKTQEQLETLRRKYTGKDSQLNTILKEMKKLDPSEKQKIGKFVNDGRNFINEKINWLHDKLQQEKLNKQLATEQIDVSLPSKKALFGTKHPLNLVVEEVYQIFSEIGFQLVSGTEVEEDLYNFQKLNLPLGHPARDMQDTFYLSDDEVLRTHATNMTARMLTELAKTDATHLAAVSLGNVYRRDDDDATHSHQFMQIDGFVVGKKISFANLKWVLTYMTKRLFGDEVKIRLRPSYFPFTEPSVEVDVSCFKCQGKGCAICKYTTWIEILGSGMIHDKVFEANNIDPKTMTGLAFGIGIERIAMLKFGISNIRSFYENDRQFLNQFKFYDDGKVGR